MSLFIGLFAVYSLIMLFIGLHGRSRPDDDSAFFGERPLESLAMAFTVTASWFGAATCLVTFDEAIRDGFASLWNLGAPTLATLALFIALAPRIKALGHVSLSQYFSSRFGPGIAGFVTLVVAAYMTLLAASQFSAWGQIAPLFEIEPRMAIVTGALCVIGYSAFGGFRSVVRTDAWQLLLLGAAVLLLLAGALLYSPGAQVEARDFRLTATLPRHLSITLGFTLAWTISPIIWQRISASRSVRSARRGLSLSMVLFSLLISMVALSGILWRSATSPGQSALLAVRRQLPLWMGLIIEIGLAAAIMSTADTALNNGALALHPGKGNGLRWWKKMNLAGAGVILTGFLALWIALRHQSVLKLMGLAGELMSCALFVPGIYALLKGPGPAKAAALSLAGGGGFAVFSFIAQTSAGKLAAWWPPWPYSTGIGVVFSALGFCAGMIWSKRVSPPASAGAAEPLSRNRSLPGR